MAIPRADLEKMTAPNLRELAIAQFPNLTGVPGMKKEELVEAILAEEVRQGLRPTEERRPRGRSLTRVLEAAGAVAAGCPALQALKGLPALLARGPQLLALWPRRKARAELADPPGGAAHPLPGYPEPTYTWQSSATSEDYEPKFSLIPLIFGTVKAAFYSLLFAIPIAILGAIYTSEFVNLKVRAVVKPTMEMMASLPSVVLGFVAALVMAPVVETWIAAVLLVFLVVPTALMAAAYLWQMIPLRVALRIQWSPKFFATLLVVVLAIYGAVKLGDWFEGAFFMGDFKAWVNGDVGGPEPMLFLLALPLCFLGVSVFVSRFFGRSLGLVLRKVSQFRAGLLEIGRWVGTLVVAGLCSLAIAKVLALLGMDVRGTFVDTYVQRNTLIVGFAMCFAVIPIIYTIAEDALNAVPEHLRAASLGCGATPWQTAIYVVLPYQTAGSLSEMVADHFIMLKVGPCLTDAFREAVFGLERIESERLARRRAMRPSNIRAVLEKVMLQKPVYWQSHYRGSHEQLSALRAHSKRDRIRYYWNHPDVASALNLLVSNLNPRLVPDELAAHPPDVYASLPADSCPLGPVTLIRRRIQLAVSPYFESCT